MSAYVMKRSQATSNQEVRDMDRVWTSLVYRLLESLNIANGNGRDQRKLIFQREVISKKSLQRSSYQRYYFFFWPLLWVQHFVFIVTKCKLVVNCFILSNGNNFPKRTLSIHPKNCKYFILISFFNFFFESLERKYR